MAACLAKPAVLAGGFGMARPADWIVCACAPPTVNVRI